MSSVNNAGVWGCVWGENARIDTWLSVEGARVSAEARADVLGNKGGACDEIGTRALAEADWLPNNGGTCEGEGTRVLLEAVWLGNKIGACAGEVMTVTSGADCCGERRRTSDAADAASTAAFADASAEDSDGERAWSVAFAATCKNQSSNYSAKLSIN